MDDETLKMFMTLADDYGARAWQAIICPCGRPTYDWASNADGPEFGIFVTHVNDRDGHGMMTHHVVDGEIVDEDTAG